MFNYLLEAADCFQGATFNFLHGYYRTSLADLRTALELVMIGTYGTLHPNDKDYLQWKSGNSENFGFTRCRKRLAMSEHPLRLFFSQMRRRRDAEAVRDLGHPDVGVGQQRLGGLDVVAGEFWRTPSGAARAPSGGEAGLGALPDQAALEFRQRAKHVKNQPPLCGRRVEGFGQTAKPDTPYLY
jgi:hypothetical protein